MATVADATQTLPLIVSPTSRKAGIWKWQDTKSKEWHYYSQLENQLIEDAYQRKLPLIELPDDYILSFDGMVVGHERTKIQREELSDVERYYTRDERFTYPLKINTHLLPEERKAGSELAQAWSFWFGEQLEDLYREAVEGAAEGIFMESLLLGEERNGRLIQNELMKIKDAEDENEILECCARLYTATSFLYRLINTILWNEDLTKTKTLGGYVWLLQEYLRKNRIDNEEITVYRGVTLTDEMIEEYKQAASTNEWFSWLGFTSASRNREVAEMFCGNTLFIIKIQSIKIFNDSSDLSTLSMCPDEEEILLMAGHPFYIDKIDNDVSSRKHLIYLSWSGMCRDNESYREPGSVSTQYTLCQ